MTKTLRSNLCFGLFLEGLGLMISQIYGEQDSHCHWSLFPLGVFPTPPLLPLAQMLKDKELGRNECLSPDCHSRTQASLHKCSVNGYAGREGDKVHLGTLINATVINRHYRVGVSVSGLTRVRQDQDSHVYHFVPSFMPSHCWVPSL
jgi:hypothetical protein